MNDNQNTGKKTEKIGKDQKRDLSPLQKKAAASLGVGMTRKETADSIGVRARTIRNWMKMEPFRYAVNQYNRDHLDRTVLLSTKTIEIVTNRLSKILEDEKCPQNIQVQAAKQLMELWKSLQSMKPLLREVINIPPPDVEKLTPYQRGQKDGLKALEEEDYWLGYSDPFPLEKGIFGGEIPDDLIEDG